MIGYYIEVPDMTIPQLRAFVRKHMPTEQELLRRARLARLPNRCEVYRADLSDYIQQYRKIPSDDDTIRFVRIRGMATVTQTASGGHNSRTIKEGLRKIVQRHLALQLLRSGYRYRTYIV